MGEPIADYVNSADQHQSATLCLFFFFCTQFLLYFLSFLVLLFFLHFPLFIVDKMKVKWSKYLVTFVTNTQTHARARVEKDTERERELMSVEE